MSKGAEFIKGVLDTERRENEILEVIARKAREEEAARDKKEKLLIAQKNKEILKVFGISELFQELVDEKVVISSKNPIYEKVPVYKEGLFGKRTLLRHDYKVVKDYTPARIVNDFDKGKITLYFDEYWTGGEYSDFYKRCVIARVSNKDVEVGCSEGNSYQGGKFEKVNSNLYELTAKKIIQAESTAY